LKTAFERQGEKDMKTMMKMMVVALVLSVPGFVMAESTPTKAPEAMKATTGATPSTTTTPTATTTKPMDTATAKVTTMPETKFIEGTISNVNTTTNMFTLKDHAGTTFDIAYNLSNTLKMGEKVKVNVKKDGMNWTATTLEKVTK